MRAAFLMWLLGGGFLLCGIQTQGTYVLNTLVLSCDINDLLVRDLKGGDLAEELAATRRKWDLYDIHTMFDDEFFDTKRVVYTPFDK